MACTLITFCSIVRATSNRFGIMAKERPLEEKVAERKAKRKAGRTMDSGGRVTNGVPMPVMSRQEQRHKMHELKARFLSSKKLEPFVSKLFDIAMDDDHDGQMAAMKMIADRILPTAGFSGEDKKSSAVQINITGLQVSSVEKEVKSDEPVSIQ